MPWSRACWAATCCGSIVEECGVVDEAKREKARAGAGRDDGERDAAARSGRAERNVRLADRIATLESIALTRVVTRGFNSLSKTSRRFATRQVRPLTHALEREDERRFLDRIAPHRSPPRLVDRASPRSAREPTKLGPHRIPTPQPLAGRSQQNRWRACHYRPASFSPSLTYPFTPRAGRQQAPARPLHEGDPVHAPVRLLARSLPDPRSSGRPRGKDCRLQLPRRPGTPRGHQRVQVRFRHSFTPPLNHPLTA